MKISVVIPAYNAEKHIARAIESVLSQTRPADEVIVVDDGSIDGTADVIRSFGERVILIQQENAGASIARNAGIQAATGDWIAFLDGDDEWLPEKLKLQSDHLQRHPDLRWTTGNFYRCHCEKNHERIPDMSAATIQETKAAIECNEVFSDHLASYYLGAKGCTDTKLIQKDLLIEAGLFLPGQKRMNDIDMWYRIAYIQPRIGFIFEPLAVYHLDTHDSIIKVHTDWRLIDEFLTRHLELAANKHRLDAFRPCAQTAMRYWIRILMNRNEGAAIRRLLRSHPNLIEPKQRRDLWRASWIPRFWKWRQESKRRRYGDR